MIPFQFSVHRLDDAPGLLALNALKHATGTAPHATPLVVPPPIMTSIVVKGNA